MTVEILTTNQKKPKSTATIAGTTLQVFDKMPRVFRFPDLARKVQLIMIQNGRYPMDGTIQREMRKLRTKGKLNYKVIDKQQSIYERL